MIFSDEWENKTGFKTNANSCSNHRYLLKLLLNHNKSGKLNTFQTNLKEPNFSTTDLYVRRLELPKGQVPIFWFALQTDQLLTRNNSNSTKYLRKKAIINGKLFLICNGWWEDECHQFVRIYKIWNKCLCSLNN